MLEFKLNIAIYGLPDLWHKQLHIVQPVFSVETVCDIAENMKEQAKAGISAALKAESSQISVYQ